MVAPVHSGTGSIRLALDPQTRSSLLASERFPQSPTPTYRVFALLPRYDPPSSWAGPLWVAVRLRMPVVPFFRAEPRVAKVSRLRRPMTGPCHPGMPGMPVRRYSPLRVPPGALGSTRATSCARLAIQTDHEWHCAHSLRSSLRAATRAHRIRVPHRSGANDVRAVC